MNLQRTKKECRIASYNCGQLEPNSTWLLRNVEQNKFFRATPSHRDSQ